jgi:tetratricopeptide (TPR) repeat protein
MSVNETETYYQSPLFREAMQKFQAGNWEEGLNLLTEVEKQFPLEVELRTLRQEMQVRSRVEGYETEDHQRASRKKVRFYAVRVGLGVLLVMVLMFAASSYFRWFQQRVETTMENFNAQVVEVEAAVKYRNAQDLLTSGRASEALVLLEELAATNPELEGLETYLNDAKILKDVGERYAQALSLMETGDQKAALEIFRQIEAEQPLYRDVSLQVQTLESQVQLIDVLNDGDKAYNEGRYADAVSAYEAVRVVDPTFQEKFIEEQLYQSYLKAADAVLTEEEPTMEALETAEIYFSRVLALRPQDTAVLSRRAAVRNTIETRLVNKYLEEAEAALATESDAISAQRTAQEYFVKALELRPSDTEVLLRFQMAQNYVAAIEAYAKNNWDLAISKMEEVVAQDSDYAQGTARQALYEALVSKGDDYSAAGEYVLALDYYQRAAIMARLMPDSIAGIFEAQTRIAEAQGLMGNYANSVFIYQDALNASDLRSIILYSDTPLAVDLRNAESYSLNTDYRNAFNLYRKVIIDWVMALDTETYQVKAGDYLPMLARRYNTTVSAILAANGLTAQVQLEPDTELIIPTTP